MMQKTVLLTACLLLFQALCLPANSQLMAQPNLTSTETGLIAALCRGENPGPGNTGGRQGLLLVTPQGDPHPLHAALPDAIQAESLAAAGALGCLAPMEKELEICEFSVFFSIPRIRQDYLLDVVSLTHPDTGRLDTLLTGTAPPGCEDAGTLDGNVTAVTGDFPDAGSLLEALTDLALDANDNDGDGYDNLAEFIRGSDPDDAGSPGQEILVTANASTNLVLPEGEAITLTISLNPGEQLGEPTDYYLYADSLGGRFAYRHPGRFEAVQDRTVSVRAKALRFTDVDIITLPALGVGEYQIGFEARFSDDSVLASSATISVTANDWQFREVSRAVGIDYVHGFAGNATGSAFDRQTNSGGVAAGDYDNDGWVDLYVVSGSIGDNLLYRNLGNERFEEVGETAGVNLRNRDNAAAAFADYDGDGWLDLIVTGLNGTQVSMFRNRGDGTFQDVTDDIGFDEMGLSLGASFADYDKDGDLDLWINHWLFAGEQGYLWRNEGDGSFLDVTRAAGIRDDLHADFTTNFADIDNDGWLDLLVAADYGSSQVYLSNGDGTFRLTTEDVISDENGMGAAVGDFDHDGDLDWFVTSIYDYRPGDWPWGVTGNRFYQNQGDGTFLDATDATGTRVGHWGWGACFADFNNDGHLDLFHVNGYSGGGDESVAPFLNDPAKLFIADGRGAFQDRGVELGLADTGQGRGIVCFDYDRDGDIDIFITNNRQAPALYRNDGNNGNHYLHVRLGGEDANSAAVGARIYLTSRGITQMRELRAGSNYLSQNPVEAYFGLGAAETAEMIRVVWPSGTEVILEDVEADQYLFIPYPE